MSYTFLRQAIADSAPNVPWMTLVGATRENRRVPPVESFREDSGQSLVCDHPNPVADLSMAGRTRAGAVDASLIVADANKQRAIPGKDWDKRRAMLRRRAVRRRSIWQPSTTPPSARQVM